MRIAQIAAGAAGMYCGSCIRDNTLAVELNRLGHECLLVPTYTPLRTDEPGIAMDRVFFGGVNVYLQQLSPVFAHLPEPVRGWLDSPRFLNWVSRFAGRTDPSDLGAMTVSILQGNEGRQRTELAKLAAWLRDDLRPQIVCLPNAMFAGMAGPLKAALRVPVTVTVSGEDLFLEGLREPHRTRAFAIIRKRIRDCDAVIATSRYYADEVVRVLGAPADRTHVVPLGLKLDGHGGPRPGEMRPPTVGYLGRICRAKGLHNLPAALSLLRAMPGMESAKVRAAGYLGEGDRAYFEECVARFRQAAPAEAFEYVGEVDRAAKVRFLQDVDVFTLPTDYRESKGLPVLEALANGTPVVQPAHGSFPELVDATGGGLLVTPGDPRALAEGLHALLSDPQRARSLGEAGRQAVHAGFSARRMAEATLDIYRRLAG